MIKIENNLTKYFTGYELEELLSIKDLYTKAYIIVKRVFKDKVDKSGQPYIWHLIRVSDKLEEECEKVAGLLHDTLEDTDITYEDLLEIGFSREILDIVLLVTKDDIDTSEMSEEEKLELYRNEIDSIITSGNIHAIRLKEADMSDNYDPDRLSRLPVVKQEWFHKKYGDNLVRLRKIKNRGKEE